MAFIPQTISISNLQQWLSGRHARELILVFCIQALSLLTSLVISFIITNLLGAVAYGTFSYGFSWVNLLAMFCCMGFEQLALKELPAYLVQNRKDRIKGYFIYSTKRILLISILTSLI